VTAALLLWHRTHRATDLQRRYALKAAHIARQVQLEVEAYEEVAHNLVDMPASQASNRLDAGDGQAQDDRATGASAGESGTQAGAHRRLLEQVRRKALPSYHARLDTCHDLDCVRAGPVRGARRQRPGDRAHRSRAPHPGHGGFRHHSARPARDRGRRPLVTT